MIRSDRAAEDEVLASVFPKKPVEIVRGEGAFLYGPGGERYTDLGANYGVANVGHAHPKVTAAIQRTAAELVHLQQTIYSPQRAAFLRELQRVLPKRTPRVFLSNSGTEAVEAALKWARATTKRTEFVAARGSFHGRTFGAVSVTWKKDYREPFEPLVPGATFVPYNDPAAFDTVTDQTAAVILEPVQGEGGVTPATRDYLRAARDACDRTGALLILDEIQTGLGRTGRFWSHQQAGIEGDMLLIGKSIAGGLPMGITAMREDLATSLPKASHGNTFGGGPLVCAAAEATLQVLRDEKLAEQSATEGAWALDEIRRWNLPLVREVRGMGLMIGLDLRVKPQPILEAMIERRVLALPAGTTVLRLLPPLMIPHAVLEDGLRQVREAVAAAKLVAKEA